MTSLATPLPINARPAHPPTRLNPFSVLPSLVTLAFKALTPTFNSALFSPFRVTLQYTFVRGPLLIL